MVLLFFLFLLSEASSGSGEEEAARFWRAWRRFILRTMRGFVFSVAGVRTCDVLERELKIGWLMLRGKGLGIEEVGIKIFRIGK